MADAVSAPLAPDAVIRSMDSSVSAASARSRSRRSSSTSSMTSAVVSAAVFVGSFCTAGSLGRASVRAQIDVTVGSSP
jgi:hypothetical protein